jgi:glucose-6-phosphate isomerase
MLKKIDPTQTDSWRRLADHYRGVKDLHLRDLFAEDPRRFESFSLSFQDILVELKSQRALSIITLTPSKPYWKP